MEWNGSRWQKAGKEIQVTEHEGMKSRNEKGLIIIGIDKARLD